MDNRTPAGSSLEASRPARVVLTGFMGAGKSTVGRLLAAALGWPFHDVDLLLAAEAGMPVGEIFVRHGEAHFRAQEANAVAALLKQSRIVVALGGGALEQAETRARLSASGNTLLVYLQTSLATALARCCTQPGAAERPVLRDPALEARFRSRIQAYRQAHLTIDTENLAPDAVAARILAAIKAPAAGPAPDGIAPHFP